MVVDNTATSRLSSHELTRSRADIESLFDWETIPVDLKDEDLEGENLEDEDLEDEDQDI